MNYSNKLKDPRWQKKRLEILERDNWTCRKCLTGLNDGITLHIHHKAYFGDPWEAQNDFLITLCEVCHETETLYRPALEAALIKELKLFNSDIIESLWSGLASFKKTGLSENCLFYVISMMGDRKQIELLIEQTDEENRNNPLPFD